MKMIVSKLLRMLFFYILILLITEKSFLNRWCFSCGEDVKPRDPTKLEARNTSPPSAVTVKSYNMHIIHLHYSLVIHANKQLYYKLLF